MTRAEPPGEGRHLLVGLARAFGGAVFFALPLLMTMEMWWLGFYMDRLRLGLLLLWMIPVLVVLDRYSGFQETASWLQDTVDGVLAFGVGFLTSAVVLVLLAVIDASTSFREGLGMVALQAVPASFGAVLANSQLTPAAESDDGEPGSGRRERHPRYHEEIFFMLVGAIFLAFNLAPTEEMIVLAFKMTAWHSVALALASLLMMHGFVYALEFHGTPQAPPDVPGWSLFLRFTLVGYLVALLVSAYVLWTFGRFDGADPAMYVHMAVVLGFPASIGAAAARLIL